MIELTRKPVSWNSVQHVGWDDNPSFLLPGGKAEPMLITSC